MAEIILGFAPTRRSIFSALAAVEYARLTREKLCGMGIKFVDINDISSDGLLHDDADRVKIAEKFKAVGVDGLFVPHTNFGTEYEAARLAKDMNVPVLLWGPRDERPDKDGVRLRDSQCGLFATGKVLRRFKVPFTYLCNCELDDEAFARGLNLFVAVCNVVKIFRRTRILQIGPRPFDFWSTMCSEGELLEKFNIQLAPVPLAELTVEIEKVKKDGGKLLKIANTFRSKYKVCVSEAQLENIAALKGAISALAQKYGCTAAAIQCWNALQGEIGIMPCAANSMLNEEGLPVACETDIHGAITSLMVEAAAMNDCRSFLADWTIRHPDNENGELLQHCGPWPASCLVCKPEICYPLAFKYPGAVAGEAKHGEMTLARFYGDNGDYSLLLGRARGIDGPYTKGTYVWVEVDNWKRLEAKIVEVPYIHHCVGIHKDVVPVLYEACKYLGIKPDLYDPVEERVKAYIRGE